MASRGPYAKGVAKREEILDIAFDLFAHNGYDRTSVREIARETGLSQAGLLHHFVSKEELFAEVLRRRDSRNEEFYDTNHGHPVTADGFISIIGHNSQEPGLVRLFVAMAAESTAEESPARGFFEERYRRLREELADDVRAGQERGEIAEGIDPDGVATLLIAAADGLQIQWLLDPEQTDMGTRLRELWSVILRTN